MMRDALELELVDANPVRAVRLPPVPTSRRAIVLTAEEIEALRLLLDAGEHQVGAALALMLVGACLRPGELLGLRVEDLRGDHLLVQRSGRKRDATKTGHTMRRVEVFGWAELALERWQAIRPTLKIKRWKRTSPFLFPVPESYLRGAGAVGQALAAVGASRAHAHDLRGTGATHLLSGTYGPPWTIADVAALLGDSIATTERAYAHVTSGRQRELADGICLPTGPRNTYRANELETRARALRAWSDSNARPLASEARRGSLPGADLAAEVGHLVAVARRYVEAVAGGDRFSHERGLDLAEAVLRAHVRAEASA
jgi:site-specific recombinase XerD